MASMRGSWLARRQRVLYDRYLGPQWWARMDDPEAWAAIENIPTGELWAVRRHLRRKLLTFMEDRARKQWLSGTISPVQVVAGGVLLDPYSLTIGFARRFATYKRGNLVLCDFDRLLRIITTPTCRCRSSSPAKRTRRRTREDGHPAGVPCGQGFPLGRSACFSGRL